MSWEYITHKCGHDERRDVGNGWESNSSKSWYENQLCTDCWRKEKKEKRQQENEQAAQDSKLHNLPELTGSDRQKSWATTIRWSLVKAVLLEPEKHWKMPNVKDSLVFHDFLGWLLTKTESNWWIDNRSISDKIGVHINSLLSIFATELKNEHGDDGFALISSKWEDDMEKIKNKIKESSNKSCIISR